jgi:hypothetical protein
MSQGEGNGMDRRSIWDDMIRDLTMGREQQSLAGMVPVAILFSSVTELPSKEGVILSCDAAAVYWWPGCPPKQFEAFLPRLLSRYSRGQDVNLPDSNEESFPQDEMALRDEDIMSERSGRVWLAFSHHAGPDGFYQYAAGETQGEARDNLVKKWNDRYGTSGAA